jgi:hypothetical protein
VGTRRGRQHAPALDVERALIGVTTPMGETINAGFFHRTLARWLGLPDGRSPSSQAVSVEWSYAFWKADLVRTWASSGSGTARRQIWAATVYLDESGEGVTYEYWLEFDQLAQIRKSGWISAAPDLLIDAPALPSIRTLDEPALASLFADDSATQD